MIKGSEIKNLILRDAVAVVDSADYELKIEAMTVTVAASFPVVPRDENDTGSRAFRRTVTLTGDDLQGIDKRLLDALRDTAANNLDRNGR